MIEAFNPPEIWAPFGPFSMGVVLGGRIVLLKGQVALDAGGRIVGKGDMQMQTRQAFANIGAALASVGGTIGDIVSLTHYVTNIEAFMKTGDVRRAFFAPPYPVTTTVQVAALYDPDLLVEITAIAEIPHERFRHPVRSGE